MDDRLPVSIPVFGAEKDRRKSRCNRNSGPCGVIWTAPMNVGYLVTRHYRPTSTTIEPVRALLAYSRCAFWISSSLKVALIGTEIIPSLSHLKSCSRSGAKFFELRFTPNKVVCFPDQKSRFFDNSLRADGITERSGVLVHAGKFIPYPTKTPLFFRTEYDSSKLSKPSGSKTASKPPNSCMAAIQYLLE